MRVLRAFASLAPVLALSTACNQQPASPPAQPQSTAQSEAGQVSVERGKYLVTLGACDDCHTPKVFKPGAPGPDLDMSRRLSGHPASEKLPPPPANLLGPDKWGAIANNNFTAWVGPWGTSFTRNLTPDMATGLGSWTEEMFIKTIRDGKHQGEGRPLLPPMPWQTYSNMSDSDLKSVWAYLRSLPPVVNAVPDPIPPAGAPSPAVPR